MRLDFMRCSFSVLMISIQEYRQDQEAWAINNLEEISLCLDILFIIHYNKEAESDFNLILKYGSLLKVV